MATNINYPAVNLPCPLLSGNTYQPGATFIRSEFDYAIRQRKQYCAQYSVGFSFVIKSQIQMETFKDFFYNTLNYGVNSFLADWEIEGMDGIKEFRFSSNYTTVALGASRYRITASFDMLTKIKDLFVIPSIQYSMDIISTELDGTRYIKNDGKGGSSFNAEAFASNHIYLNGTTQSVPYPVLHTLGDNHGTLTSSISGTGNTMTDDDVDTFTIHQEVVTLNAYQPVAYNTDSFVADKVFKIVAVVTITNGTGNMRQITYGDADGSTLVYTINETVSSGTYTYEVEGNRLTDGSINFQIDGTQNATLDATVVFTVQEITLPTASYLTYFDSTTNTLVELSSTGDVGVELIENGDLSDGTNNWTPTNDADLSINAKGWLQVEKGGVSDNPYARQEPSISKFNIGKDYLFEGPTYANSTGTGEARIDYNINADAPTEGNDGSHRITYEGNVYQPNIRLYNLNGIGYTEYEGIFTGKEVLPISTIYSVTDSHQFVFNHTSPLSASDKAAIGQDPNLALRMFLDGEVLPSGFSNTDVDWFSGGNEGLASAEKVYDLSDQAFLTYVSIVDYDALTRTTLDNQSNGASNLKLIRDGSGRTTGTAAANTTQWEADGRTAVTNWTIIAPFTITEPIGGDTYTFTSDGNRYKNTVADGTYTLPTGVWTLDEFGFDGVTPVTARGVTKKVNEIVVP